MQTTDILSLTLSALATARKASRSIDERLQLNLAGQDEAFAPVEFTGPDGESFSFTELLARHPAAAFGLVRVPLSPSSLPATVTAGLEGTSSIALAVENEAVYSPVIYYPPETTLTASQVDRFLSGRAASEQIRARIPLDPAAPGPIPADTQRELSLAFSNASVSEADQHAWHDLVQRHRIRLPARFLFRHQPGDARIERPAFEDSFRELRSALEALSSFAARTEQRDWAGHFQGAIAQLSLPPDPQALYGVLAECGRPPVALRLLNAVQTAWVFGGMGSWNDVPTAGSDEHEALSSLLLDALMLALLASANTD